MRENGEDDQMVKYKVIKEKLTNDNWQKGDDETGEKRMGDDRMDIESRRQKTGDKTVGGKSRWKINSDRGAND